MHLIGIPLRKPSFGEVTSAAVLAVGLWLLALGLIRATDMAVTRIDAGALLLVAMWGCVGGHVGVRVDKGQRHLVANLLVSGVLLAVYQGSVACWS